MYFKFGLICYTMLEKNDRQRYYKFETLHSLLKGKAFWNWPSIPMIIRTFVRTVCAYIIVNRFFWIAKNEQKQSNLINQNSVELKRNSSRNFLINFVESIPSAEQHNSYINLFQSNEIERPLWRVWWSSVWPNNRWLSNLRWPSFIARLCGRFYTYFFLKSHWYGREIGPAVQKLVPSYEVGCLTCNEWTRVFQFQSRSN